MMDDLVAWLRACADEDEARALAAEEQNTEDNDGWWWDSAMPESATEFHIAAWPPKRVLAEVKAKRLVLAVHEHFLVGEDIGCGICAYDGRMGMLEAEGWCETLRLLALPYADRPGYRPEWAPAE